LEQTICFRPPWRLAITRAHLRLGMAGYVGATLLVAALLLALSLWAVAGPGVSAGLLVMLGLAALIPATDVATALVNRTIAWNFGAVPLPALALRDGVPPEHRTLVAVPTLLTSQADLLEQIERLEVHHLSGAGGELAFALLTDGLDAPAAQRAGDAQLLAVAVEAIERLNERYGPAPDGSPRFYLLHRERRFNAGENCWMGWERKRGKLHELNRLLRGATDTSFVAVGAALQVPAQVRYVITLDADTRLPRDAALRLIGKMAHPLNRPRFDQARQRVVGGYGILQPRVTPSLPVGREGSLYQRLFSAPGGIDPYAAAASDVYQDLFGEGSYTGKGIYDVDAFEAALAGRVPPNTLLSHDLFEGIFARAGLASDVEVIEEFPARYDVAAKRQHRWTRGDWQLLPWVLRAGAAHRGLPPVGLGKVLDNLRRSLAAPMLLATLALGWLAPLHAAVTATLLVLAAMTIPAFLAPLLALVPRRSGIHLARHLRVVAGDLRLASLQTFFSLALLPDQTVRMADAIVRTLVRLAFTRRHLLEWTTAAQSARAPRLDVRGFYQQMVGGVALGVLVPAGALLVAPATWPAMLPLALLWLAAPALAAWASRSPRDQQHAALAPAQALALRLIARRTWRFFETFVTPAEHMLPPDNFQEDPAPAI
ncbi:MAG TPA: glycosyl transferase, partial [Ramlibacter sp.]|nr:glycosyl transferase [Ramlibacter sp.]